MSEITIEDVIDQVEPVEDGLTGELAYFEISPSHFQWLVKQSERNASDQGEAARLREALERISDILCDDTSLTAQRINNVIISVAGIGYTEPVGDWIDEYCPKCGAQMLGNKIGNEWCSSVVCNYGVPCINTGEGQQSGDS